MACRIFITAHGGRDAGTSRGTYLVPPNVNLWFYTDDAVLLKGDMGMAAENLLTRPALDVPRVRSAAKRLHRGFDIVPNYTAFGSHHGDPAFQFATGVYYVGSRKNRAPALALEDGESMRLGDIIAAFTKTNGAPPSEVFWLCCRAVPQNANNAVEVSLDRFGSIEKPQDMGLPPSQVVAQGGQWR